MLDRLRKVTARDVLRELPTRVTGACARYRDSARRARQHGGRERDTILMVTKSIVAAVAAWAVATRLMDVTSPVFAPFAALLVVQITVYRTVLQSLRFVAAMVAGIAVAAGVAPLLGQHLWSFGLLLLVTLMFGQWRRLGVQGVQVPVAAMFAYVQFSSDQPAQLLSLALLVVIGAAIGVLTNVLIIPPLRANHAARGVDEASAVMYDLLSDISEGLHEGIPDSTQTEDWQRRANDFDDTMAKARMAVEQGVESATLNPRRLLPGAPRSLWTYRVAVESLARAGEQVRSITQGLHHAAEDAERQGASQNKFMSSYADLLAVASGASLDLGDPAREEARRDHESLSEHIDDGREKYTGLAKYAHSIELDSPGQLPIYGALLTDAKRLLEEFERARQQALGPTASWR